MLLPLMSVALAALQPLPPAEAPAPPPLPAVSAAGSVHRVPYRLTETKHLLVRARLNGKGPFNFLIDTGAPALFVSTEMAQKAGVTARADGWGDFERLEIEGGAVLEKVQARIQEPYQLTGMNAMGLAGSRIDGVFGYNVLSLFRMEIDLTRPAMTWTRLSNRAPILTSLPPEAAAPPAAPSKNMAQMEGMARMLSALMQRPPEAAPAGRGFLGVEVADTPSGVQVSRVLPESPAALAGLKTGDRIMSVAPGAKSLRWVQKSAEVRKALARVAGGDGVRMKVLRGKSAVEISITAGPGGL
jgi:hypothetical protein